MTRIYEVCFDALPQAVMQAIILVQLSDDERNLLLWGSIIFSALSVSYLVAMMEVDLDTDLHFRSAFERIHGYMPSSPGARRAVVGGTVVFVSGFLLAKMTALSVLFVGSRSSHVAITWLCLEFIILTLLRAGSEGTFRFQVFGTDTVLGSLVMDIVLYVLSIGAPLFVLRFPGYLGPSVYLP
eukprot:CAMPEP_0182564282 /NCGR_PEP_ID=MMETSP1324-20130603/6257_1 /TAXON_ID=236786 /ORGANISM="Florenciella sp., Strain RCC1587" /LENGTH=182 /DNA_ID=CAMNT_0024777699 /DNA_START=8 /DNA_END=552 /DNA_ORIENTATION=-